jgi:hypothetical protein
MTLKGANSMVFKSRPRSVRRGECEEPKSVILAAARRKLEGISPQTEIYITGEYCVTVFLPADLGMTLQLEYNQIHQSTLQIG